MVRKGLGGAPQRAAAPRMHQGRKTGPEGGFAARIGELPALQVVKHPKSICIAHFCVKTTGLAVVLFAGARDLVPRSNARAASMVHPSGSGWMERSVVSLMALVLLLFL